MPETRSFHALLVFLGLVFSFLSTCDRAIAQPQNQSPFENEILALQKLEEKTLLDSIRLQLFENIAVRLKISVPFFLELHEPLKKSEFAPTLQAPLPESSSNFRKPELWSPTTALLKQEFDHLLIFIQSIFDSEWTRLKTSETLYLDAINLYFSILENRRQWQHTALEQGYSHPVRLELNPYVPDTAWPDLSGMTPKSIDFKDYAPRPAQLIISPQGKILVHSYKNAENIGNGQMKKVFVGAEVFEYDGYDRHDRYNRHGGHHPLQIRSCAIMQARTTAKLEQLGLKSREIIAHEGEIFQRIEEYQKTLTHHGENLVGLMRGYSIQTAYFQRGNPKPLLETQLVTPLYDSDLQQDKLNLFSNLKTDRQAQRLYLQGATGLYHFHQLGLVHSDVKPPNFMYDKAGKQLVLADFGLAFDPLLNRQENGTPKFLAPEFYLGQNPQEPNPNRVEFAQKADVYAYGLTACLLMYPLQSQTPCQTPYESCMAAHLRQPTPPIQFQCLSRRAQILQDWMVEQIPMECRDEKQDCFTKVIADTLSPQAADRPTSASVRNRLESILDEHGHGASDL
jgi:serine/threonine protein kinase